MPGETEGANLFDPVTSPGGTWYLVHPSRGLPAPGQAQLRLETAPVGGTGPDRDRAGRVDERQLQPLPERELPRLHLEHAQRPRPQERLQGQCAVLATRPHLQVA